MEPAELAALQAELSKPVYAALSDQAAVLAYNATTVATTKAVSGSEIINSLSASELSALTTDQRLNLLLLKDATPLDFNIPDDVAKLDNIFVNGSAVHTRVLEMRNTTALAFAPITTHKVQQARGAI